MKLLIVAIKPLWKSTTNNSYYTNGGFPLQVKAISELFDQTRILCPVSTTQEVPSGLTKVNNKNITIVDCHAPHNEKHVYKKLRFIQWIINNTPLLIKEIKNADAVHAVVMGDIGILGMLYALIMKKRLLVRYCGNWLKNESVAEIFVKKIMIKTAGGRNVMLATGGGHKSPSKKNPNLKWIFSTSLNSEQLRKNNSIKSIKDKDRFEMLVVSRQTMEKGTHKVIKAISILKNNYNINLTGVGDGPDMKYFKDLVKQLRLDNYVNFVGEVRQLDVLNYMREADIYCFPSVSSEGFPKSVLEAISFGIPVLSSSVSVLPHLFKDGGGIILKEPHIDDIIEKTELLIKNKNLYKDHSMQAIKISKNYSIESWRDNIGSHLNQFWGISTKNN